MGRIRRAFEAAGFSRAFLDARSVPVDAGLDAVFDDRGTALAMKAGCRAGAEAASGQLPPCRHAEGPL